MNSIINRFIILFLSVLWGSSFIYAHGGMMMDHDGDDHDHHHGGMMSSSYSSGTTTRNISTGTSDCIWGGPDCRETYGKKSSIAIFVAGTMDLITEQAAQGKGEHLKVLAYLMGCSVSQEDLFSQELQRNYSLIFNRSPHFSFKKEISYVLKQFDQIIDGHKVLRQTCHANT